MATVNVSGYTTGRTLTFSIYTSAGVARETGSSLTETPASSGLYLGTAATIISGDNVVIKDGSTIIGGGEYQSGVVLASDGLDSISTTEPAGKASTFREMIVQLYRRFFGKTTLSLTGTTQILTYKEDGETVATTQSVEETSTIQTQGEAS